MSILMGSKRICEDIYQIKSTDGVTMTVSIEGIDSVDYLKNKIIWLVSPVDGGVNSTININNLGAHGIVSDLSSDTIEAGWCKANVPFPVTYTTIPDKNSFLLCK